MQFLDALDDQLATGTRGLIDLMAAEAGVELRLGTEVTAVAHGGAGVTVTTSAGEAIRGRVAVVALPVNVWSSVEFSPPLSTGKQTVSADGHAGHAAKVWVLADGVPNDLVALGPDDRLGWLSTERHTPDGDLLVGFGVADHLDVSDAAAVADAVRGLCPGANVLAVDGHDWTHDPYSRGAWAWYRPGQLSRHHSDLQRAEGRLLFAGSDIASHWMSWIEGALGSGHQAASDAEALLVGLAAAAE